MLGHVGRATTDSAQHAAVGIGMPRLICPTAGRNESPLAWARRMIALWIPAIPLGQISDADALAWNRSACRRAIIIMALSGIVHADYPHERTEGEVDQILGNPRWAA